MSKDNPTYIFKSVSIKSINVDDQLTNFSWGVPADSLQQSIEEIGVIHPVTLAPVGNGFRIVCGHKRIKIVSQLKIKEIPARILDLAPSDETMLMLNLSENQLHHHYSDIEKGLIFFKLSEARVPETRIIEKYMQCLAWRKVKNFWTIISVLIN